MTIYGGIDPGKTGAIVKLDSYGNVLDYIAMPLIKHEPFSKTIPDIDTITSFLMDVEVCAIEELPSRYSVNGSKSRRTQAIDYGVLLACLFNTGVRPIEVKVNDWKTLTRGFSGKKKEPSLKAARLLYKDVDFDSMSGTLVEGVADALLIANYAITMERING